MSSLPAGIFDRLAALEGVYLVNNRLTSLPPGIFDKLTGLHSHLHLSRNRLYGLTRDHPLFDKLSPRYFSLDSQILNHR